MTLPTTTVWNVTSNPISTAISDSAVNLTMTDGGEFLIVSVSPAIHVPYDSRDPVIVKAGVMLAVAMVNLVGNGIALAAIWRTPKLRTKTFALLASLTVADLLSGLTMLWVVAYQLLVYVFSEDSCLNIMLVATLSTPSRFPTYVSTTHAWMISIERFIAIAYPLYYQRLVTDATVKWMVAFSWIFPGFVAATFWLFIARIDWTTCSITSAAFQSTLVDTICLLVVFTTVVVLYSRILTIALKQRAKIDAEVSVACWQEVSV
jgi:hypothetical protein